MHNQRGLLRNARGCAGTLTAAEAGPHFCCRPELSVSREAMLGSTGKRLAAAAGRAARAVGAAFCAQGLRSTRVQQLIQLSNFDFYSTESDPIQSLVRLQHICVETRTWTMSPPCGGPLEGNPLRLGFGKCHPRVSDSVLQMHHGGHCMCCQLLSIFQVTCVITCTLNLNSNEFMVPPCAHVRWQSTSTCATSTVSAMR